MFAKTCPWCDKRIGWPANLGQRPLPEPPKRYELSCTVAVCPFCSKPVKLSKKGQVWLYAQLWAKYGQLGFVKWVYETALLPIMTIYLTRSGEAGLATSSPWLYVLVMLSAFIVLSDFSGSARNFFLKNYPEPHEKEQRMLFLPFSPSVSFGRRPRGSCG